MLTPRATTAQLSRAGNGVVSISVPGWSAMDWLWHGFSTRLGGVSAVYVAGQGEPAELNLGLTAHDTAQHVQENRDRFVEAVTGSRRTPLVTARQVHSSRSTHVDSLPVDGSHSACAGDTDGLMTRQPGILVGIQTADCIPVLVADPVRRAVAAFHAGWRGTVGRIVALGVARMQEQFGSDPAELVAAIGPGIGACCYTVGPEVRARFEAAFADARELFQEDAPEAEGPDRSPRMRLDLTEANRRQLVDAGLPAHAIVHAGGCTACQPRLFFSHRASGGYAGRMMAAIGIRPRSL